MGDDPIHLSGVTGKKNMKGADRVTSFHVYPDGTVKFPDKALGEKKVPETSTTAEGSTSAEASTPAKDSANDKTKK